MQRIREPFYELLNFAGITNRGFAILLGVSTRTIAHWVKEDRPIPAGVYIVALCLAERERARIDITRVKAQMEPDRIDMELTDQYYVLSQVYDKLDRILKTIGA